MTSKNFIFIKNMSTEKAESSKFMLRALSAVYTTLARTSWLFEWTGISSYPRPLEALEERYLSMFPARKNNISDAYCWLWAGQNGCDERSYSSIFSELLENIFVQYHSLPSRQLTVFRVTFELFSSLINAFKYLMTVTRFIAILF